MAEPTIRRPGEGEHHERSDGYRRILVATEQISVIELGFDESLVVDPHYSANADLLELMADLAEHLVPAARERQGRPPVVVRCAFAARVRPTHAIALHARRDAADVVEVDVMADGTRAASATLAFGTPP